MLGSNSVKVMIQFIIGRANVSHSAVFHTRSTGSTEDLEDIQDR